MTHLKRVLFLATALFLATPGLAAAEEPAQSPKAGVTTYTSLRFIPPGYSHVTKWTVEQIPGKVFDTKAEAITAWVNANLPRMDLHPLTVLIPLADGTTAATDAPAQNR